ncbi:MAG: AAA family ATPase [Solirubrobacteraceae bacterium]
MSPPRVTGEAADEVRQLVPTVEQLGLRLSDVNYLADEGLAAGVFLSLRLPLPLLLEGEAGVGKTQLAKALAAVLNTPLIRLQCYEGIDAAEALYEWNYPRQLLSIRLSDSTGSKLGEHELFGPDYLIRRPLLRALEHPGPRPAVLLIDEIDRADDDFEAFLLELLAEATVTIPEIGTIQATHPPIVVLTSNRTRDLHDAIKRRCLYQWIDYPDVRRESDILMRMVGGSARLIVEVATAIARMRAADVIKPPGVAESIDWLAALKLLGIKRLDPAAIDRTLGSVLKYPEDQEAVRAAGLENLIGTGDAGTSGVRAGSADAGAASQGHHDTGGAPEGRQSGAPEGQHDTAGAPEGRQSGEAG